MLDELYNSVIEGACKRYLLDEIKNNGRSDFWYREIVEMSDLEKVFQKDVPDYKKKEYIDRQLDVGRHEITDKDLPQAKKFFYKRLDIDE